MPVMSKVEQVWCRSLPWRAFTRRVVFPWAIGRDELRGDVLELGSGSGAMAVELLERYPTIRLTATDVDPAMRAAAAARLAPYGARADVREADATALPFADATFDAVVSFIMLHHVIDWEKAVAEIARVLRPGGVFTGYDLVASGPTRLLHRVDRSHSRPATAAGLRAELAAQPFTDVAVSGGLAGLVVRFAARRDDRTPPTRPPTN